MQLRRERLPQMGATNFDKKYFLIIDWFTTHTLESQNQKQADSAKSQHHQSWSSSVQANQSNISKPLKTLHGQLKKPRTKFSLGPRDFTKIPGKSSEYLQC